MSNQDESAIASMNGEVEVHGDAPHHLEIARLKRRIEELEGELHGKISKASKSRPNDIEIASAPVNPNKDLQGIAFPSGRRQELANYIAQLTDEDKDITAELLRKSRTVEYTATENDLTLILPLMVNKGNQEIFYDRLATRDEDLDEVPTDYINGLMKKVHDAKLIKNNGLMDEDSLLALVKKATKGSCQEFRPQRSARSTNMIQESLIEAKDCGEMFLQQVVYSPIAELFSCFDLSLYCADKHVSCAHAIKCQNEQGEVSFYRVGCSPDAVIRLTKKFYLIAMMELKADDGINADDLYRCQLMTSLSLLALLQYLKTMEEMTYSYTNAKPTDQPTSKPPYENLAMPFVLGNHDEALLYVTRFETFGDKVGIVFSLLKSIRFSSVKPGNVEYKLEDVKKKVNFMSMLAVLVADIFAVSSEVSNEMNSYLQRKDIKQKIRKNLPNAIEGTTSASTKTQSSVYITKATKKQKSEDSARVSMNPSANEDMAKKVASWNGKVQGLDYPWTRVGTYNLDATEHEQWEADMEFYMQESPFYFRGVYGSTEVFCKVWREGDRKTCRQVIIDEINFNHQANKSGVPSSKFFEELTALDIYFQFSPDVVDISSGCKYHVMVNEYHRNDEVAEEDVSEFANLLVDAVLTLHNIGILHCDIKRSNILWDSQTKVVRLVDFGLAQNERNAVSYHATREYEAPEIRENHPHSRMSDAFAVGKTIEEVIDSKYNIPDAREVMNVAKLLQCPDVFDRLSLENAKSMLMSLKVSSPPIGIKRRHEDMKVASVFDKKNDHVLVPLLRNEERLS